MKELVNKIESYPFESEGGDLRLCADWQQLKSCIDFAQAENAKLKQTIDEMNQLQRNQPAQNLLVEILKGEKSRLEAENGVLYDAMVEIQQLAGEPTSVGIFSIEEAATNAINDAQFIRSGKSYDGTEIEG